MHDMIFQHLLTQKMSASFMAVPTATSYTRSLSRYDTSHLQLTAAFIRALSEVKS